MPKLKWLIMYNYNPLFNIVNAPDSRWYINCIMNNYCNLKSHLIKAVLAKAFTKQKTK